LVTIAGRALGAFSIDGGGLSREQVDGGIRGITPATNSGPIYGPRGRHYAKGRLVGSTSSVLLRHSAKQLSVPRERYLILIWSPCESFCIGREELVIEPQTSIISANKIPRSCSNTVVSSSVSVLPPSAMLCTSCRRTLLLRLPSTLHPSPPLLSRSAATVPATPSAPPSQPPPSAINLDTPPPTLSSSPPGSSQPLSKPTVTLPLNSTAKPQPGKEPTKPTKLVGSIPGGAPLFGVAYLKAKPTVLAMEDDAYPDWLWGLVDEGKKSASSGGGGGDAVDLSCKLHSYAGPPKTVCNTLTTLFMHPSRPHS
jgi:Mitochondrial ribosomal protein L37